MKKSGSAGWPWNLSYASKADAYHDAETSFTSCEYWNASASTICTPRVFHTMTKDEKRPLIKVLANSVRTICGGPLEVLETTKRITSDFNGQFQDGKFKLPHTLGFNPMCGEFNVLARYLTTFAQDPNSIFDSDGSKWDATSMSRSAFECIAYIRFMTLAEEEQTVANLYRIMNVYSTIVDTIMTSNSGFLIRKQTGNVSGQNSTTEDNSLLCSGIYALVHDDLALVHDPVSYGSPESNLRWFTNGDDNICASRVKWFNYESFKAGALKYSVTFDRDSLPTDGKLWPIQSASYLSHGFKQINGAYYGLPEIDKIRSIVEYSKKKHSTDPVVYLSQLVGSLPHLVCYQDEYSNVLTACRKFVKEFDTTFPANAEWEGLKTRLIPFHIALDQQRGPF